MVFFYMEYFVEQVKQKGGKEQQVEQKKEKLFLKLAKEKQNAKAGISYEAPVIELASISTMPVVNVTDSFLWGEDVYLIYEHCFGIDATNESITLSHEHTKMEQLTYEETKTKLKWDSNRNTLWELNWKLTKKHEC